MSPSGPTALAGTDARLPTGASSPRDTCRLCGGAVELVVPLRPTPIGEKFLPHERLHAFQEAYPLDLGLCRDCGHTQLLHVIEPELLYSDYIYHTADSLGLGEHFAQYADDVVQRIAPAAGSLVVDIGSNDGTLLRYFQQRWMRVLGVDPAREIAQAASRSGIPTMPELFTPRLARAIRQEHGPAAIVTANNVFANIDDLIEMIEGVRCLLALDGVFVFETSYLVDVIQKTLLETIFHEHLSYFSIKPLERFFRRVGMQLIDCLRVPTKNGSVRGTAQLADGRRPVSPTVGELIELETRLGLGRPEPFAAFAEKIQQSQRALRDLVGVRKAEGKTIAGYGATVGVVTLIYQFEVGDVIRFLIDDNPWRQGRFSPGLHLPVRSPQALYEQPPDDVIIFAWAYAEPIIAKHRAYLKHGGRFIVPLPTVTVVTDEDGDASP